jgi:hypothetical protein
MKSALAKTDGFANDRSLQLQQAEYKSNAQIEQLRQTLLSDPVTARAVLGSNWQSKLEDQYAFQTP